MSNVQIKHARNLQEGDLVDLQDAEYPLPFEYDEPRAEFEYGEVDSIEWETDDCLVVHFINLGSLAIDPDHVFSLG